MKLFRKWLYYAMPPDTMDKCAPAVREFNAAMLYYGSLLVCVLVGINAALPLFFEKNPEKALLYLGISFVNLLLFLLSLGYRKNRFSPEKTLYWALLIFQILVFFFTLWIGVVLNPRLPAVSFMIAFITMNAVFLVKVKYALLIGASELAIFCVSSFIFKTHSLFLNDMVNGISALAVTLVISWSMSYLRLSDIVKKMQMEDEQRRLEAESLTDELTGLRNRRDFFRNLNMLLKMLPVKDKRLCLAMMDIDYFKAYNDHYGHPAGDRVLRAMGAAISDAAKGTDVIAARVGGEEFALVWLGTDEHEAENIVRRVTSAVNQLALPHEKSKVSDIVTLSAGIFVLETFGGCHLYRSGSRAV